MGMTTDGYVKSGGAAASSAWDVEEELQKELDTISVGSVNSWSGGEDLCAIKEVPRSQLFESPILPPRSTNLNVLVDSWRLREEKLQTFENMLKDTSGWAVSTFVEDRNKKVENIYEPIEIPSVALPSVPYVHSRLDAKLLLWETQEVVLQERNDCHDQYSPVMGSSLSCSFETPNERIVNGNQLPSENLIPEVVSFSELQMAGKHPQVHFFGSERKPMNKNADYVLPGWAGDKIFSNQRCPDSILLCNKAYCRTTRYFKDHHSEDDRTRDDGEVGKDLTTTEIELDLVAIGKKRVSLIQQHTDSEERRITEKEDLTTNEIEDDLAAIGKKRLSLIKQFTDSEYQRMTEKESRRQSQAEAAIHCIAVAKNKQEAQRVRPHVRYARFCLIMFTGAELPGLAGSRVWK